eukprot:365273-Chlamydomonas_euryale.AAC.14
MSRTEVRISAPPAAGDRPAFRKPTRRTPCGNKKPPAGLAGHVRTLRPAQQRDIEPSADSALAQRRHRCYSWSSRGAGGSHEVLQGRAFLRRVRRAAGNAVPRAASAALALRPPSPRCSAERALHGDDASYSRLSTNAGARGPGPRLAGAAASLPPLQGA